MDCTLREYERDVKDLCDKIVKVGNQNGLTYEEIYTIVKKKLYESIYDNILRNNKSYLESDLH